MSNKTLAFALLLAVTGLAQAQTAPTFGEFAEVSAQLKMQEMRNKLNESRAKDPTAPRAAQGGNVDLPPPTVAAPGLPPPIPSGTAVLPSAKTPERSDEEKIQLVAIYGVGDRLSAELEYNGSTHTVRSSGRNSRVGPWTVESVTPYYVGLMKPGVKSSSKKGHEAAPIRKEIFLSSEAAPDESAAQKSTARGMSGSPMGMPFNGVPTLPSAGMR